MDLNMNCINKQKGVTVKDVPAKEFIQEYAKFLKKGNKIRIPEWATYYKTACYKDLSPYDPDWLYIRAASVAYQLYMRGKVGVNTLRKHYSKKQRSGTCTEHSRKTAGKCIRYCLIELENAQLVGKMSFEDKTGNVSLMGKALTKRGQTDMDRIAAKIAKEKKK
jgi:small subunit ribosomal protein S19e